MDTLALLCNLHADGPATLHKLRRSGCESIAALLLLDPPALASSLDWDERLAERFLREAGLLAQRLDEEVRASREFESDEDEEPVFSASDELEEEADELESACAPPPERVEAVLDTWRELDRVSPPPELGEYVVPRPSDSLPNRALEEVQLIGLTPALRGRLHELGVLSLRGLVEAGDLELARAIPLGFTRLKHLQFLAARELGTPESATPALATEARGAGFDLDPLTTRFDTAGPFA